MDATRVKWESEVRKVTVLLPMQCVVVPNSMTGLIKVKQIIKDQVGYCVII